MDLHPSRKAEPNLPEQIFLVWITPKVYVLKFADLHF